MDKHKKNWFKFALGFFACFLVRLIPFRPPNIEPILATQMPVSRVYGAYAGFLFGFLSIFVFDFFTSGIGMWTLVTGLAYGFIALGASYFFKQRKGTAANYALFAVLATLFFDAATGLTIGPLFYHQSFIVALVGQIPFTMMHLLGNVSFAALLSPAIYASLSEGNAKRIPLLSKLKVSV